MESFIVFIVALWAGAFFVPVLGHFIDNAQRRRYERLLSAYGAHKPHDPYLAEAEAEVERLLS